MGVCKHGCDIKSVRFFKNYFISEIENMYRVSMELQKHDF